MSKSNCKDHSEARTPGWSLKRVNLQTLRRRLGVLVIKPDVSGSMSGHHDQLRGVPADIAKAVTEAVPQAAEGLLVAVTPLSGGIWAGEGFSLLKDMTWPECETGGGSPILAGAGAVAELLADCFKTLEQEAIQVTVAEVMDLSDFQACDRGNDAGRQGLQTWHTGLSAMPAVELSFFGPANADREVVRMLSRPDKPQELEVVESFSLGNAAVLGRIIAAVRALSLKSLNKTGSNPNVRPRRKPPTDLVGPKAADRFAK